MNSVDVWFSREVSSFLILFYFCCCEIDVNELLAAHERLRFQEDEFYPSSSESSSCVSSLSSSDDDLATEINPVSESIPTRFLVDKVKR